MRTFILIAVLFSMAFSVNKATKPYTFVPHTTSSATQVNSNFDSLLVPLNKAVDTLNNSIPRKSTMFQYLKSGDTLIDTLKVNKIRSNPDVDSLAGLNVMRGNPDFDSIQGLNKLSGNPVTDSMSGMDCIRGNPDIDSLKNVKSITGNVSMDSINGLDTIYSDAIKGKKIIIDTAIKTVRFADSIVITKAAGKIYFARGDSAFIYGKIGYDTVEDVHTGRSYDFQIINTSGSAGISILTNIGRVFRFGAAGSSWGKGDIYDTGMVAASNMLTNYIQFGTAADSHFVYLDTTVSGSLYEDLTKLTDFSGMRIVQTGSVVHLYIPEVTGTKISSATSMSIHGIPEKFISPTTKYHRAPVVIINAGVGASVGIGTLNPVDAGPYLYLTTSAYGYLSAGTSGLTHVEFSWIK